MKPHFKKVELSCGDLIPFVDVSDRLGRAEFIICPQWKRGKLVGISIYPMQQEDMSCYYEWKGEGVNCFYLQSYQSLEEPKVWMHSYCKEHKCQSLRLYVPRNAKYIWFKVGSTINIGFLKEKIN
jgi:hypothetical protein